LRNRAPNTIPKNGETQQKVKLNHWKTQKNTQQEKTYSTAENENSYKYTN
jgi:hypothetical protein